MKNKHRLLIGIIIILVAIGGYYFKDVITGYAVSDTFDEVNLDELPVTDNRVFEVGVEAVQLDDGSWGLYQKYRIDNDDICIDDCVLSCKFDGLEYYRAYVQRYGVCMCKCLPAN